jgi:hypothetical protein
MPQLPLASLTSVVLASLVLPTAGAQQFVPTSGASVVPLQPTTPGLPASDEGISGPVPLAAAFPMPDGVVTTTVQVTSNGRLAAAGGSLTGSDPTPSIAEIAAASGWLCPFWFDLDSVQVLVDTASIAGTTVITWQDVRLAGRVDSFSFQVQLDGSDGSITFVYDDRVPVAPISVGVVGISGGGVSTPSEFDFTTAANGLGALVPIVERFTGLASDDPVDLVPPPGSPIAVLHFAPKRSGAFTVTSSLGRVAAGSAEPGRTACFETPSAPVSLTLVPADPGFLVVPATTSFDWTELALGQNLGLGDDQVVQRPLSFAFPMPGGAVVSSVAIDSNGRILEPHPAVGPSFAPDPTTLLSAPFAQICPFWGDLAPGLPLLGRGEVRFFDDGTGSHATITWDGVAQFGRPLSANTFQARLWADGTIDLHYLRTEYDPTLFGALVGISSGGGLVDVDGESDLWGSGAVFSTDQVLWESFVAEAIDLAPVTPPANRGVTLQALSQPIVGAGLVVSVFDPAGTASAVTFQLGVARTFALPLGSLDPRLANCSLFVDTGGPTIIASGTANSPTLLFDIPDDVTLVGLSGLAVQALVFDPTRSPRWFPTDEIALSLGSH